MVESSNSVAFTARVDRLLASIETAFDQLSDEYDVDVERTDSVMTITFESGRRMVVNSQEANREVWLAAKSGGFHYRWDDERATWRDTRGGDDFGPKFVGLVFDETGATLRL